jgi:hypothetical protein
MLAAQAPFDLGHEVFRESQGIESLLEGRGGVLCLAAVLSSFGRLFSMSFAWAMVRSSALLEVLCG